MIEQMTAAATKMLADFEASKSIDHGPTKGRAREYYVFEHFLRPYLPRRFSLSSAILLDIAGRSSRQQDLVVFDEISSPVMQDIALDKILFPESVFASIEVKSSLGTNEIDDCIQKAVSVSSLRREFTPAIIVSPGMSIQSNVPPIMVAVVAFQSSVSVDALLRRVRKSRETEDVSHALSLICVLEDPNGAPGLIVSVDSANLGAIAPTPKATSALASISTSSPGEALLLFYLILMDHLKSFGRLNPGPNIQAYVAASGISEASLNITPEDARGGKIEIDDSAFEYDKLDRFRVLSQKFFKTQDIDDDEILEWFTLMPELPQGSAILDENAVFAENDQPLDLPPPIRVLESVIRYRIDSADDEDKNIVQQFLDLMKSVVSREKTISIGVYGNKR